mmetsp:Transcript_26936/g.52221  ORF Transcript_26936/g.52221 Transcript_26936/m.52221 type:complete len:243 (-) Transcript_26936:508-1236(-)
MSLSLFVTNDQGLIISAERTATRLVVHSKRSGHFAVNDNGNLALRDENSTDVRSVAGGQTLGVASSRDLLGTEVRTLWVCYAQHVIEANGSQLTRFQGASSSDALLLVPSAFKPGSLSSLHVPLGHAAGGTNRIQHAITQRDVRDPSAVATETLGRLLGFEVPESERTVERDRHEVLLQPNETHLEELMALGASDEAFHDLLSPDVPHLNSAIRGARSNHLAIWRPHHRVDGRIFVADFRAS